MTVRVSETENLPADGVVRYVPLVRYKLWNGSRKYIRPLEKSWRDYAEAQRFGIREHGSAFAGILRISV